MGTKYSNYHRTVFSRKRAVWGGMDQGKGDLYRGDYVEFMLNFDNRDNVMRVRDGQEKSETAGAGINAGKRTLSGVSVVSESKLFFNKTLPEL